MTPENTCHFFLVDDHPAILDIVGYRISTEFPNATVTTHTTIGQALETLKSGVIPNFAVVDLRFHGGGDGAQLIGEIKRQYDIRVIGYSGEVDEGEAIRSCFENSACGFVHKSAPLDVLVTAIKAVIAGGMYFPPAIMRQEATRGEAGIVVDKRLQATLEGVLLAKTNQQIATELNHKVGTIKNYVTDLLRAFGVNSRGQLLLKARELRILQPPGRDQNSNQ